MREIPLSKGKLALVDDCDYAMLAQFKWHAYNPHSIWYAARTINLGGGHRKTLKMHRFILNAPDGLCVDHRNGDGLDNRRENLRLCTIAQNTRNRVHRRTTTSSRFRGVYWHINRNKWMAFISIEGVQKHLGSFESEIDAALAYDAASRTHHGEFGTRNFALDEARSKHA